MSKVNDMFSSQGKIILLLNFFIVNDILDYDIEQWCFDGHNKGL